MSKYIPGNQKHLTLNDRIYIENELSKGATFKDIAAFWDGSNYYGGMAEGLVGITDLASFAAEGTQQKVDEATAGILSGDNNVFDGVLETNTGKKIGKKGKTLDDATITGKINWYYRNVVVLK